jgi:hypothetical protein
VTTTHSARTLPVRRPHARHDRHLMTLGASASFAGTAQSAQRSGQLHPGGTRDDCGAVLCREVEVRTCLRISSRWPLMIPSIVERRGRVRARRCGARMQRGGERGSDQIARLMHDRAPRLLGGNGVHSGGGDALTSRAKLQAQADANPAGFETTAPKAGSIEIR